MKQVDSRLEELEQRVDFEAGRLDRLHPLDAKNIVDQLEHDIRLVEENIQSLFGDVTVLRDGRYAQSSELQKRFVSIQILKIHNVRFFTELRDCTNVGCLFDLFFIRGWSHRCPALVSPLRSEP